MTDREPCPLEGRRERSDLIWSLITTAVSATGAYAHLLHSLLGDKHPGDHIPIFILFPYFHVVVFIIQAIIAFLITSLDYDIYLTRGGRRRHKESPRSFEYLVSTLIGAHITAHNDPTRSIQLIEYRPNDGWLGDRNMRCATREDSRSVVFGQATLQFFLTCQCFGSTFKGIRRYLQDENSMTAIDAFIFWYALSGSIVLIRSWVALFLNRKWTTAAQGIGARSSMATGIYLIAIGIIVVIIQVMRYKTDNILILCVDLL